MTYVIWTDGACSRNPGPGGWAFIVRKPNGELVDCGSGHAPEATNNRMEIKAALEALKTLPEDAVVELRTDSMYLIKGITQWISGWKRKGWINSRKEAVSNRDLWEELYVQDRRIEVEWVHVKGHAGDANNEWCDEEAVKRCRK